MSFRKFIVLFRNIGPETPLGRVIQLRSTPDKDLTPALRSAKRNVSIKDDIDDGVDALFKMI